MSRIYQYILLTRPYSYVCNVARGILVCGVMGLATDLRALWVSAITSLLMWVFLNWTSDARQKDEGRIIPPLSLQLLPMVATLMITVSFSHYALFFFFLFVLTIYIYPMKAVHPNIGLLGPLFRGFTILAHFLYTIYLISPEKGVTKESIPIIAAFTILHIVRNLIGDVRDVQKDRYEFPKKFGIKSSLWVIRFMFILSMMPILMISDGIILLGYPTLLLWGLYEFLTAAYGSEYAFMAGYVGHRVFVVLFTLMEVAIAHAYGVNPAVCLVMIILTVVLNLFYTMTPGKSYPKLSVLRSHFFNS